jgi:uncharacterized protein DUF6496
MASHSSGQQSSGQRKTVGRVMHEWKHGELERSRGGKVTNRRQAIAIALSEAGASNRQTPGENRRRLARTKAKERRGETAQQQKEGARSASGPTRAQLYRQAAQRQIRGRSRMSKAELQRALRQ